MNRLIITAFALLITIFIAPVKAVVAQDTTWVQTFTWEEQNNPETSYDYPGRRWFEFPSSDNGDIVWELRNYMGSLVASGEFSAGNGFLLNVEMSSLASGVYSLSIEDDVVNTLNWVVKK